MRDASGPGSLPGLFIAPTYMVRAAGYDKGCIIIIVGNLVGRSPHERPPTPVIIHAAVGDGQTRRRALTIRIITTRDPSKIYVVVAKGGGEDSTLPHRHAQFTGMEHRTASHSIWVI